MNKIILKNIQLPEGLQNADAGTINQSEILPVVMNRIIGEFDESLLTVLGCEETTETEKQNNAA
jgi:hypothetical protein